MEKYGLLFESVFKRKLTDGDAVGYLENITKEHPYFSVAQFFLLGLSAKNVNGYKTQARKTAVLFNNNHWLNFQLLEAGFDNGTAAGTVNSPQSFPGKIAGEVFAPRVDTPHPEETSASSQPRFDTVTEEEQIAAAVEEIKIEEEIKAEESGAEEPVVINEPLIAGASNTVDEVVNAETPPAAEESHEAAFTGNEAATIEEVVVDAPAITEDTAPEQAAAVSDQVTAPVNEQAAATDGTASVMHQQPLTEDVYSSLPPTADISTEAALQNLPVPTVQDDSNKATENPDPLLFEPLHTSDYFASVGIKLSEEEKNAGNLGKQLKSFTDWLKTMKKVHAQQLSKTSSSSDVNLSAAETSIRKMAEKSNQENEVVTEAMADVLLQQGKADKAVEILEKLSLLNPGKSVYFAAKINQIKDK